MRMTTNHYAHDGTLMAEWNRQTPENVRGMEGCERFFEEMPGSTLSKGDIVQPLPRYLESHQHLVVSLLHLDMDVYEPTRVALEKVVPRMPRGAVIVFDELNQIPYPGETRAVQEVLGLSELRIKRFPWETGISYAILE
jgi:hypothetical protein